MLNIYHAAGTRSIRVIWLCEELELPYQVTSIDFSADYRKSPEWRALNPVGKVPVMSDGDITMYESGAMMQYILEKYAEGRLQPQPGTALSARYLQWCWFAEATFARPLGDMAQHTLIKPENERIRAVVEDGAQRAHSCLGAVEAELASRRYLLDDFFSAADIMMAWSLTLASHFSLLDKGYPNVERYLATISARPGSVIANSPTL